VILASGEERFPIRLFFALCATRKRRDHHDRFTAPSLGLFTWQALKKWHQFADKNVQRNFFGTL
jgi:hypothetical protein